MAKSFPKVLPKVLGKSFKFNKFIASFVQNFPLISNLRDSVTGDALTLARASSKDFITDSGTFTELANNAAAFTGSGILIEPSHTNYYQWSRTFSNAWWTKYQCSVNQNLTDPLGNANSGWTLQNTLNNVAAVTSTVLTFGSGNNVLISGFFKEGTQTGVQLSFFDSTTATNLTIIADLRDGSVVSTSNTVGTIRDYGVEDAGNGWYRVWLNVTTATYVNWLTYVYPYDVDSGNVSVTIGDNIGIWQMDGQFAGGPTSPIHSLGANTTSLKDDYTWSLAHIPPNDFEISFLWTPQSAPANGDYILSLSSGANGNEIAIGATGMESNGGSTVVGTFTAGTTYTVKLTRTSVDGETLEVVGVGSDNTPAATGDITWPATGTVGSRYTGGSHSHSVIANLKVSNA